MPTCEICGKEATGACQDLKEVPSPDQWSTWEKDGELHWRCDDHPRLSKTTYLDGRTEIGLQLWRFGTQIPTRLLGDPQIGRLIRMEFRGQQDSVSD